MPPKQLVNHSFLYLFVILFFLTSPTLLYADISTDGTVGAAKTLTGPDYTIPETLGSIKGDNLFHSFDKFSIKTQESATFTGSDSIKNVISRVTGGEKSEIDGTLRSNVGKADFYFINPNGVVFGQNAKVDVPAAFHVSTTDELKFADGASFKASKSETSTLTQAAPESFGFLGTQSASIEVNGSTLDFKPEGKVSLTSSKDITIKGTEAKQAVLLNEGGEITLKAKGDLMLDNAKVSASGNPAGTIQINTENISLSKASIRSTAVDGDGGSVNIKTEGIISLKNYSDIIANNLGAGDGPNIEIKASDVSVENGSLIDSRTVGTGPAGGIMLDAANKIKVSGVSTNGDKSSILSGIAGNAEKTGQLFLKASELEVSYGGSISSGNFGSGYGAELFIDVDSLSMFDGGTISSLNTGNGHGGELSISLTGDMTMTGDFYTSIQSIQMGNGQGGSITINSGGKIDMDGGASISIGSHEHEQGVGGDLTIHADEIELTGGSIIFADCNIGAGGQVGNIFLKAEHSVLFDGYSKSKFNSSGISSKLFGDGSVGKIEIETPDLTIKNGGKIGTENYSSKADSSASDIIIRVNDLTIASDSDKYFGYSEIANSAAFDKSVVDWSSIPGTGVGNSGSIMIEAKNRIVIDGDNHMSGAAIRNEGYQGTNGNIQITAGELVIFDYGMIRSTTQLGAAGDITINVDKLDCVGGLVSNSVKDTGIAGTINIHASDSVKIQNAAESPFTWTKSSRIESLTVGKGGAGNIFIDTPFLSVANEGEIFTTTDGVGEGGDITINSSNVILQDGANISSSSNSQDDAGKVRVNTQTLSIDGDSTGIYSSVHNNAKGYVGKIEIKADEITLMNGGIISIAADQTLSEEKLVQMPTDKSITLKTKQLNIESGSSITSESTKNVPASDIKINADSIYLHDGVISTSVLGTNGDGGDISINDESEPADFLVMQNGFIQANTNAKGGTGGKININADALLKESDATLEIGGDEIQQLQAGSKRNIIQAADPSKNPQDIEAPEVPLDLGGQIINAGIMFSEPVKMADNYCRLIWTKRASSLTQGGKGGIPESSLQPSSISFGGKRLDELLMYEGKQ